ncbi:hypothetical protein LX36DRAFT_396665 [Colletotrichum falcatum]|nr:hypothetical protein LX36DRAFT_396665 [Colletotrichum falcatum]
MHMPGPTSADEGARLLQTAFLKQGRCLLSAVRNWGARPGFLAFVATSSAASPPPRTAPRTWDGRAVSGELWARRRSLIGARHEGCCWLAVWLTMVRRGCRAGRAAGSLAAFGAPVR